MHGEYCGSIKHLISIYIIWDTFQCPIWAYMTCNKGGFRQTGFSLPALGEAATSIGMAGYFKGSNNVTHFTMKWHLVISNKIYLLWPKNTIVHNEVCKIRLISLFLPKWEKKTLSQSVRFHWWINWLCETDHSGKSSFGNIVQPVCLIPIFQWFIKWYLTGNFV